MKRILRRLAWLISIVLWCVSFYLLLSKHPYVGGVRTPEHGMHTLMFFGLAFMTTCAQQKPNIVLTLAALYLFGGFTEIAQHFNPPRTCDPLDFMEDVIGATVGLIAALVWMSFIRRMIRSTLWMRLTFRKATIS